jgi:hypothetical protein
MREIFLLFLQQYHQLLQREPLAGSFLEIFTTVFTGHVIKHFVRNYAYVGALLTYTQNLSVRFDDALSHVEMAVVRQNQTTGQRALWLHRQLPPPHLPPQSSPQQPSQSPPELLDGLGNASVVATTSGTMHHLVLTRDTETGQQRLWGRGDNTHGQLSLPGWRANTALQEIRYFLTHDGIVHTPETIGRIVAVVAACNCSFLLTQEGSLYATGLHSRGQLGLGTGAQRANWPLPYLTALPGRHSAGTKHQYVFQEIRMPTEAAPIVLVHTDGTTTVAMDSQQQLWITGRLRWSGGESFFVQTFHRVKVQWPESLKPTAQSVVQVCVFGEAYLALNTTSHGLLLLSEVSLGEADGGDDDVDTIEMQSVARLQYGQQQAVLQMCSISAEKRFWGLSVLTEDSRLFQYLGQYSDDRLGFSRLWSLQTAAAADRVLCIASCCQWDDLMLLWQSQRATLLKLQDSAEETPLPVLGVPQEEWVFAASI